jgi:hypothetical protein
MIYLLPMGQVLGAVAICYATLISLLVALSWKLYGGSVWGSIGFAVSGATALQAILFVCFHVGWRYLWRQFPALNRFFPDISGKWTIRIAWQMGDRNGNVDAEATIEQNFLRISMDVTSPDSESQTLIAQPKRDPESGRALLYYVYLVTPKARGTSTITPYYGAAILKFSDIAGGELSGNYWTTKQSFGHFLLARRASDLPK